MSYRRPAPPYRPLVEAWLRGIEPLPLGPQGRKAASVLSTFMNGRGVCFPAQETIAAEAGCSRRTVCYALGTLERAGCLRRQRGTRGRSTRYRAVVTVEMQRLLRAQRGRTLGPLHTKCSREKPPEGSKRSVHTNRSSLHLSLENRTQQQDTTHWYLLSRLAARSQRWADFASRQRERRMVAFFARTRRARLNQALQQAVDDPDEARNPGAWLNAVVGGDEDPPRVRTLDRHSRESEGWDGFLARGGIGGSSSTAELQRSALGMGVQLPRPAPSRAGSLTGGTTAVVAPGPWEVAGGPA